MQRFYFFRQWLHPYLIADCLYARVFLHGTKSSNARIWVDTLNRVNALITMQHFDSFNDFVMTMLDEYEENLSENDYKYQGLIIQMYNNKKKEDS